MWGCELLIFFFSYALLENGEKPKRTETYNSTVSINFRLGIFVFVQSWIIVKYSRKTILWTVFRSFADIWHFLVLCGLMDKRLTWPPWKSATISAVVHLKLYRTVTKMLPAVVFFPVIKYWEPLRYAIEIYLILLFFCWNFSTPRCTEPAVRTDNRGVFGMHLRIHIDV